VCCLLAGGHNLDAGGKGLMRRAIAKANSAMVEAVRSAPTPQHGDANSVRALIDVIKKEEVTVCVDLHTKVNVCACAFIICILLPSIPPPAFAGCGVERFD